MNPTGKDLHKSFQKYSTPKETKNIKEFDVTKVADFQMKKNISQYELKPQSENVFSQHTRLQNHKDDQNPNDDLTPQLREIAVK